MDEKAFNRSEYIKALNASRTNYQNYNPSLINTMDNSTDVGNELSSLAYVDTRIPTNAVVNTPNSNNVVTNTKTKEEDSNWFSKLVGTFDQVVSDVRYGFLKGIEGVFDFGANTLGAMGWEDASNWAKIDISRSIADQYDAFHSPFNFITSMAQGKDFGQYMSDAFQSTGNVFKAIGGDESGVKDQNKLKQQYDNLDRSLITDTQAGQFVSGISQSIGEMLPSIIVGNVLGATAIGGKTALTIGKETKTVAELVSLAQFGVSAGGNSMEQNLQKGMSSQEALGRGVVAGAIETGTEMIPWGAISKFLPSNKLAGIGAKTFREFGGQMLEEGLEEVIGDVATWITDSVIFGDNRWDEAKNPEFYSNLGMSFLSGAVVSGVMGGTNIVANKARYGKLTELDSIYTGLNESQKESMNVLSNGGELSEDFLKGVGVENARAYELINEAMSTEKGRKQLKHYFADRISMGVAIEKYCKENNINSYEDLTKEDFDKIYNGKYKEELNAFEKGSTIEGAREQLVQPYVEEYSKRAKEIYGDDVTLITQEDLKSQEAFERLIGRKLTQEEVNDFNNAKGKDSFHIGNKSYVLPENVNKHIKHESITHGFLDQSQVGRDKVINAIKSTQEGKEVWDETFSKIQKKYGKMAQNKSNSQREELFISETLANIMENYANMSKIYNAMDTTSKKGISNFINKLQRTFTEKSSNKKTLNKALEEKRAELKEKGITDNAKVEKELNKVKALFNPLADLTVERLSERKELNEKEKSRDESMYGKTLNQQIAYSVDDTLDDLIDLDDLLDDLDLDDILKDETGEKRKVNDLTKEQIEDLRYYYGLKEPVKTLENASEEEHKEYREREISSAKAEKELKRKAYESLTKEQKRELSLSKALENKEKFVKNLNKHLSPKVQEYFKDSVVRANDNIYIITGKKDSKYLIPMFHGTPNSDMYFFDSKRIGTNGTVRGNGFYLTSNYSYAKGYSSKDGKTIASFLNITNPASERTLSITKDQVKDFVKKHIDSNAEYGTLSNWGDVNSTSYDKILNKFVDSIFEYSYPSDYDLIEQLYHEQTDLEFDDFFKAINEDWGFDGYLFKNRAEGTIAVAWFSNQIKDISNVAPTKNDDIRFSLSDEVDSDGNQLSNGQKEFFKDSKARDENGNLLKVYHSTFADFTIFDIYKTKSYNYFGKGHYFTTSLEDIEKHYKTPENHNDTEHRLDEMVNDILEEKGISYEDTLTSDPEIIKQYNDAYNQAYKYLEDHNKVISAYLNIKNPLILEKGENVGSMYTYVLVDSKGNIYDDVEFTEAYEFAKANDFDGIIDKYTPSERFNAPAGTIHLIAFESNQIKNTDNLNPTKNPDIRYSINDKVSEHEKTKDVAEVNNDQVYSYNAVEDFIKGIKSDFKYVTGDANAKVTFNDSTIANKKEALFNALNKKGVTKDELHDVIMDLIKSINTDTIYGKNQFTKSFEAIVNTHLNELVDSGSLSLKSRMDILSNALKEARLKVREEQAKKRLTITYRENIDKINNNIASGIRDYFSTSTNATLEVSVYQSLMKGVEKHLNNKSLKALSTNVKAFYTENEINGLLENYGLTYEPIIVEYADMLENSIVERQHITVEQMQLANAILGHINKEIRTLKGEIKSENITSVRKLDAKLQAILNANGNAKDNIASKVKNYIVGIDSNIRSPISLLETLLGENNEYVIHLRDDARVCERNRLNAIKALTRKLKPSNINHLKKLGEEKIKFGEYQITKAQGLKILDIYKSVGDNLIEYGGSLTINGKRVDIKNITKDMLSELDSHIDSELKEYNDIWVGELNGIIQRYTKNKFKQITGFELPTLDNAETDEKAIYYPTSRVGDKASDIRGTNRSISPADWGLSFLKQRTHSNALYNLNGDIFRDIQSHIYNLTNWGENAKWYHKLRIMENTRAFDTGTSFNALMQQIYPQWDKINDFIHHTALGIPYDSSHKFLDGVGNVLSNVQQVAMMDLFTQIKTLGSSFTGWQYFGTVDTLKGMGNYLKAKPIHAETKAFETIKKYSPALYKRMTTAEAFNANIGKDKIGSVTKVFTTPVRLMDAEIHLVAYYTAELKVAKKMGITDIDSLQGQRKVQFEKEVVHEVEKFSETTQPTTAKYRVGMYRSGANGKLVKQLFGMFQSMGQNIYQGFVNNVVDPIITSKRIKAYEQAISKHEARIKEYAESEKEINARLNAIENKDSKEYKEVKKELDYAQYHKKGHETSKLALEEALTKEKEAFTPKNYLNKLSGYVAGLIGSGLLLVLIQRLKDRIFGRKEWDETIDKDPATFLSDVAYSSFVQWIPIIGTFANAFKNDTDLTVFTVQNLNAIKSNMATLYEAIKTGDGGKITGSTAKALMTLSSLFGIPATAIWNLVNGVWYNVDKDSNVATRSWLGMLSSSSLRKNLSDAIKNNQVDRGEANLGTWMWLYSAGSNDKATKEIFRLSANGINNIIPRTSMTSYTNEKGEEVNLTKAQQDTFAREYRKASKNVDKVLSSSEYRKLDDKSKAKALKHFYDFYYDYAKWVTLKTNATTRGGRILQMSKGKIDMSTYTPFLSAISNIEATKTQSKKELALKYINSIKGLSKNDRLILAYLSGYKLSDTNKKRLVSYLKNLGGDTKSINETLAIE